MGTISESTTLAQSNVCKYLCEAGVSSEEAYGELVRVTRVPGDGSWVELSPNGAVDVEAPLRAGDVDDGPVQRHHLFMLSGFQKAGVVAVVGGGCWCCCFCCC